MDLYRSMKDPQPTRCPTCKRDGLERVYNSFIQPSVDAGQENLNGGLGMWYPQAGAQFLDAKTKRHRNPKSHARSRYDMMESIKRRGGSVEKA